MSDGEPLLSAKTSDHLVWIGTRMSLDGQLMGWIRHGFALITVGFGSFAFLEAIVRPPGESASQPITEPSRIFSLVVTAVGVAVIAIALTHNRMMVAFVNTDTFGTADVPKIPHENWNIAWACGAAAIGLVSFIALLFLR